MSIKQSIIDYFARVREFYLGSQSSKEEGNSVFPRRILRGGQPSTKELPSSDDNKEKFIDAEVIDVRMIK